MIDDAIVVLENIYRFIEEKHEDQFQAAIDATEEIGLAVLATTLSLVAIFVPVGFMGGIVGRFMKSFGLTMAFAIMVSLLVSFTLTPMLSARWLKVKPHGAGTQGTASKESAVFHAVDVVVHAHAGMVDGAPRRRRRAGGARSAVERAALHGREQELPAATTISRSSRSTSARRRARASKRPKLITNRMANAVRTRVPEVRYTLVTDRRRPGADA